MDIRPLTPNFAVSPQITPEDVVELKAQGFTTIVCNRPDAEIPPGVQSADIKAVAEAEGLRFIDNPLSHGMLDIHQIDLQRSAGEGSPGPVLAYCASGNRSSILWALGQAGLMPTDDIIAAGNAAGYSLDGLRPQIDGLAAQRRDG